MSTIKANTWLNTDGTENFKCRAWVNFDGTGTVAIRASGNVSSITDNGNGDWTVNFTNAMPDTNYAVNTSKEINTSNNNAAFGVNSTNLLFTPNAIRLLSISGGTPAAIDATYLCVSIYR